MIDIINTHVSRGVQCVLITGRLVERNSQLDNSVKVVKIIRYNRKSGFYRLLTWSIGFIQIWIQVLINFRKETLFIVSNPPIAPLLPIFVKNKFKLLIFDVYPDALSELGYLSKDSMLIKLWKRLNRKVYQRATGLYTITTGMKMVLANYTDRNSITVVPLWTDNSFLKPIPSEKNPFIKKHSLDGKFIVMYSGNLGLSSNPELLIELASVIDNENIIFLIIGEGAKKQRLVDKVETEGLKNVLFLPWQPANEMPYSFAAADLAVIFHGPGISKLAIPSKLYDFLSAGAPLFCVTSKESEVERLVENFNCGKSFLPDDLKGMMNFILKLSEDKSIAADLSANSLEASNAFSIINTQLFLD